MSAPECPGTGRVFTGGTTRSQVICPVCHRSGKALGFPRAKRRDTVPTHAARQP